MEDGSLWPNILLIVVLTAVNAFFASAEMAMVSANSNKIKELSENGDKRAEIFLDISKDQTRFLSTIQVAITLAGFFSSGSAATSFSKPIGEFLENYSIPYGDTISFILITIVLSYITLVFGELVPKRIALGNSEKVALSSAKVIAFSSKRFNPFVKLLSLSTVGVLKLTGNYSEEVEEKISEEELKSYIRVSSQQGVINTSGEEMIVNIMEFDDTLAEEIMTPRTSIYMIDYDEFDESKIDEILNQGYSRIPVFRENQDKILGVVNVKDLFKEYAANDYKFINLDNCIKEAYFVPETKKIDILLKEFQEMQNYMAILIDEYGGLSGMVTMEDIVEEIEDEYDRAETLIKKISDKEYIVEGSMGIDDVNSEIGTFLFSNNHETISGLIIENIEFIPEDNNKDQLRVKVCGCVFTILSVTNRTIDRASIKIVEEEQDEAKKIYKKMKS